MLDNPTPAAPDSTTTVTKRYAPPNQRNRSLNRRKSGEKSQITVSSSNVPNENSRTVRLIGLEGCFRSDAALLLSNRWAAAMHQYNDTSIDISDRPVMHSGSNASAWSHFRLPHQMVPPVNNSGPSSGSSMDFLSERR